MGSKITKQEFVKLIEENQDLIWKVVAIYHKNKTDQEDAFQEILLSLWKAYPTFQGRSKISTWMYRVALNTVIAGYRKSSNKMHNQRTEQNINDDLIQPEHYNISEDIECLYMAIEYLSDIEKAIIMLYMEEKSYEDIADILGMTRTNVGVKINRIKKKLKKIYNKVANGY